MPIDRLERVNVLVRREIASAIPSVIANSGIDLAALMVTGVRVASNLRNATVSVSILGHEHERGAMLGALRSRHAEFQKIIVEKGDHVLDILSKMEGEEDGGEELKVEG